MSTTNDDYENLVSEEQAIAVRRQFVAVVMGKIDELCALVKWLPATHRDAGRDAVHTLSSIFHGLIEEVRASGLAVQQAGALIDAQSTAITELTTQRDATLDELAKLVKALEQGDVWDSELLMRFRGKVYENVMEEHNSNFWESLPYDMADVLGKGWQHMDANALYRLITLDLDDEEVMLNLGSDYGYTREMVLWARRQFLKIVRRVEDNAAATGG